MESSENLVEAASKYAIHLEATDQLQAAELVRELLKRLGQINTFACYASEENTAARAEALLQIGKLARGEEAPAWPTI